MIDQPKTISPLPPRQQTIADFFDAQAPKRDEWLEASHFFYDSDRAYMRFLIPEGLSVLEIGCGNGQLLAALKPSHGLGIDISPKMIQSAKTSHPDLNFLCGNIEDPDFCAGLKGQFDVVVVSDTVGLLDDCQAVFAALHRLTAPHGRIVVAYYMRWWNPLLKVAEKFGEKMPQLPQNWLTTDDIMGLLDLANFDPIRREWRQLLPMAAFGLGNLINRFIAPLPGIRRFCLRNYVVARPVPPRPVPAELPSVTVLVPCRNERGNIEAAIQRMPRFAPDIEVIFAEGNSSDNTYEECERVRDAYPDWDIKVLKQPGKGKGDAVRAGFAAARGDILMILDADLTVPPEDLPKFYEALVTGHGEFANGTRLVYSMEEEAMRPLNFFANRGFALIFSYLLNQRFTDTLCGTKVLWRKDYESIVANRNYFGEFDPFGDFDLLFGAAKLSLKIVEIPIRYANRTYGETQISRFADGFLLLRMVIFAWNKLKAF